MSKTKFFFITDVHGSDRVFRKFVNAGKFYKANVLILGGDITGKMIVPFIKQNDGSYRCKYSGQSMIMKSSEEIEKNRKDIRDSGFYPYLTDEKEFDELDSSPESVKQLFTKLMVQSVKDWLSLAEERLKGTGIKVFISPGNDDVLEIDNALDSSSFVINPEGKVVYIDDEHEMITLGYTNHTPWHSPREVDEDVLQSKIESMANQVKQMEKCIFNIHVPPIETSIDQARKLDANLKPMTSAGQMLMTSAGSVATRNGIEKYQPLLGVHGHIHESKGMVRIGRTLCFNPGSEYTEGVMRGLLCDVEGAKIKSYLLTSG
jgi:uncharacterized protein